METSMNLEDAIYILEISNLDKLSLSDLKLVKHRAQKRWHPDQIIAKDNKEQIDRYTKNFQKIDSAIELIENYIKNKNSSFEYSNKQQANFRAGETPDTVEILRRHAPIIQKKIKTVWGKIKEDQYKFTSEKTIIFEGWSIQESLEQDLNDDIHVLAIKSFFGGILFFAIISLLFYIFKLNLLSRMLDALFIIYTGICFLYMMPLVKLILPEKFKNFIFTVVQFGLDIFDTIIIPICNIFPVLNLFLYFYILAVKLIKILILTPIYKVVAHLAGEKKVGKMQKIINYYAGVSESYIDNIINIDVSELDNDDLITLGYLYGEFNKYYK